MALSAEEIFEAATDEQAFAGLAKLVADAIGARSGVVHWRLLGTPREAEISYSGYFSQADMALYEQLPNGSDLWARAINAPGARNRIWDGAERVAPSTFEQSVIYNDWIRRLGDDTYHCIGGVLENSGMVVEVGFHRGKSQSGFDSQQLQMLQRLSRPILQTMKVRQSLAASRRSTNLLNSALDSLGLAIFKLSVDGEIIHRNFAADQLLMRDDQLMEKNGRLTVRRVEDRARLTAAIAGAAGRKWGTTALAVRRATGEKYVLSLITAWTGGEQTILLMVEDPDHADLSVEYRLQELYDLTSAEALIAVALAQGAVPEAIARGRGTSVDTVRGQIKSLAAKLGCRRQPEIISLVHRVTILSSSIRTQPVQSGTALRALIEN